ncbi:hypothetical protein COT93_03215 [Candidatus Falkowbacteria bacterium CG10_big_fil_rev_8_21_14_0_10_37_18]|uniref:O-antigen ligase-related domain-containing protein n=1 Tax=Candidatus Falkowbacteria bacterium CG10_big_fil_rev_8_21_14_0_10_37_18 TaxID=1974562 RepID=A0A2H0V8D7_9BACT|nr:MAG: hypothetical protein COT93_03215 [Candidatus Falkowbacteria bacterium CG10_big_fil_rev_8_21_14_0_10_37_18]
MALQQFSKKWSGREVLDLLIETVYLSVIFLIPLWFAYLFPTYSIFELNKSILFKILVWSLLFLTVVKIILYYPAWNFLFKLLKKYWLVPALLVAGGALSLLNSLNPVLSFLGTPERQGGLSNYFLYFLWFVLLSFNILTVNNNRRRDGVVPFKDNWHRVVIVMVFSSFLVALYAILQILHIDFLTWPEPPYLTGRALSTFGQPNFLASWLLMVMPLGVYLFISETLTWRRLSWVLVILVQFFGLLASGSRGALGALLLTIFLWLVYLLISSAWSRRNKIIAVVIFIFFSLGAAGFLNYISYGRLQELKNLDYGSLGARRNFYSSALRAISDRPWLGYGPESGSEVFIRYYWRDWALYGNVGQSADRAHNIILDELLSGGLVGLLLTLVLYYLFFRLAWQNIKNKREPDLSLALSLGLVAYLLSLLLSFKIVAAEVYFWSFWALLVVLNFYGGKSAMMTFSPPIVKKRFLKIIFSVTIVIALAAFVIWRIGRLAQIIVADYYFNTVYKVLPGHDYFTILELSSYEQEQNTNSANQETYDYLLASSLNDLYPTINELAPRSAVRDYLIGVDNYLPARGYKNLFIKGKINLTLGNFSLAELYLNQVSTLSPHWPLVIIEEGNLAMARGDNTQALARYNLALINLPNIINTNLPVEHLAAVLKYQYLINKNMAAVYDAKKEYDQAEKYYQASYVSNPDDFTLLKKIADTYYYRGDLVTAIQYNQHGFSRSPADYNWPLALAALYYEQGDNTQGDVYLQKARMLAPASAQEQLNNLAQHYQQTN